MLTNPIAKGVRHLRCFNMNELLPLIRPVRRAATSIALGQLFLQTANP